MASLKGHTGSTGRASAVLGRWHPLILSAGSQLAGPSPSQRASLPVWIAAAEEATAGHRLGDAVERDQSRLRGEPFLNEKQDQHPWEWKLWKMHLTFQVIILKWNTQQTRGVKVQAYYDSVSRGKELRMTSFNYSFCSTAYQNSSYCHMKWEFFQNSRKVSQFAIFFWWFCLNL